MLPRKIPPTKKRSLTADDLSVATLFAATALIGSGLMFVVEPMIARMILPRLGGTPAVWNTCMVFFQAALLGGYGYVHLLTKSAPIRRQVIVHVALIVVAAVSLPVAIEGTSLPPVDISPIPWLLLTLAVSVGAPFLMLSATSPLLQYWFAQINHRVGRDPYHLYAASNLGSIVALVGYPVVVEPFLSLTLQSSVWAFAYWVFIGLLIVCASLAMRRGATADIERLAYPVAGIETVSWQQRIRWVLFALVPSSLLLSVTTYLSMDVAAFPLLWIVPLTLYLLSFVVAFARRPLVSARLASRVLPFVVTPLVLQMATIPSLVLLLLFPLHLGAFFLCALALHTGLVNTRPSTERLTEFYFWVGIGGVGGGLLNTLVAPLTFTNVTEYPIGLVAACLLQPLTDRAVHAGPTRTDLLLPVIVGTTVLAATAGRRLEVLEPAIFAVVIIAVGLVTISFWRWPIRFGLAIAAVLATTQIPAATGSRTIHAKRTFFGVLRVQHPTATERHVLFHGSTIHGAEDFRPGWRDRPLTYFHRSGPIGQVMAALDDFLAGAQIGVIGLGTGSLAAYAKEGQQWTFFEIDPGVAAIARNPDLFTYLSSCGTRCRVVFGDARLSLERSREGPFALVILDAFSSDAIPVHLLTREALGLYLSKLTPDGVLAFHISNRFLNLEPVVAALGSERDLRVLVQYDPGSTARDVDGHYPSRWMVMAKSPGPLQRLASDQRWHRVNTSAGRVWTDDYSNIVSLLTVTPVGRDPAH